MPKQLQIIALIVIALVIAVFFVAPLSVTGNTLTVYVKDNGVPVPGLTVKLSGDGVMFQSKVTGASGSVQWTGLNEGWYTVTVVEHATRHVYVGAGTTLNTLTIDITLDPPLDPGTGGTVQGYVFSSATGSNIQQAMVTAVDFGSVLTDSNGYYTMTFGTEFTGNMGASWGGHSSVTKSVIVSGGVELRIDFAILDSATVDIQLRANTYENTYVNVQGATITIGTKSETTNQVGYAYFIQLPIGTHTWAVSPPSEYALYSGLSGSITLNAGDNGIKVITITYPGANTTSEMGHVVFALNTEGSNLPVGQASISLSGPVSYTLYTNTVGTASQYVVPGIYTYTIVAAGYSDASGVFSVDAGGIATVSVVMSHGSTTTESGWSVGGVLCILIGVLAAGFVFIRVPLAPYVKAILAVIIVVGAYILAIYINSGGI